MRLQANHEFGPITMPQRGTPGTPDQDIVGKLARLAELEATISTLRHDLSGMLAPALLVVDRLLAYPDPKMMQAGETVLKAITQAEARLAGRNVGSCTGTGLWVCGTAGYADMNGWLLCADA